MNPNSSAKNSTAKVPTKDIADVVDTMMKSVSDLRKPFERRWYDNKFFDDGFHYRFIQRSSGRMVDLSEGGNVFNPFRAIPKASKQIRSIANTLLQNEYRPIAYPRRIIAENFSQPQAFSQAVMMEKENSKKVGLWLQHMWEIQRMKQQMAQLFLSASIYGVAYLKIWPDRNKEIINQEMVDAFDINILGYMTDWDKLPFLIESHEKRISEIKANPMFEEEQLMKISPENKYASSEIKEAYMRSRYGLGTPNDYTASLILKEAHIDEYINDDNLMRIRKQKDAERILAGKNKGDKVNRQVFVAGNVWLRDKYLPFDKPYLPLQLEPGPFYQTPLIERFISMNKSLDTIVSRVERIINTTAVGAWMKRKGENFQPSNMAGGIMYEYEVAPPTQLEVAALPNYILNFVNMLSGFIAEQGMPMTGGSIPKGKNSAQALEAMKANEVNNIKMIADQWGLFLKRWAETMVSLADDYFIKPQEIQTVFQGSPVYVDVVGQTAFDKMTELGIPNDHLTPISKKYSVEIRAESGLGYTPEAKKAAALQLSNFMLMITKEGIVPPTVMQQFIKNLLESFNFGSTQEFMELVEKSAQNQVPPQMLDQIKLAVAQVMHDIMTGGKKGQPQGQQPPQGQPQQSQPSPQGGGIPRTPNNPIQAAQPKPVTPNNMMSTVMGGMPQQ